MFTDLNFVQHRLADMGPGNAISYFFLLEKRFETDAYSLITQTLSAMGHAANVATYQGFMRGGVTGAEGANHGCRVDETESNRHRRPCLPAPGS